MPLVPGFDLHLSAKAGVQRSGTSITGWTDQVTGTRQLVVPATKTAPVDGDVIDDVNEIDFTASCLLQLNDGVGERQASPGNLTITYALMKTSFPGFGMIFDAANGSNRHQGRIYNNPGLGVANGSDTAYGDVSSDLVNVYFVATFVSSRSSMLNKVYVNNIEIASGVAASGSGTGITLGGNSNGDGTSSFKLLEFVEYYDSVSHDSAQRQQNVDYIFDTYSLVTRVASGAVTFNDVAFSNGVVDFFSAPYTAQGAITKVEQVAIQSGVATMTVERDPLLDYFGIARGMTQDFTGTLASAPAGDVISTGLDLTGVSIGGANDDHYIFRATGGTGAGTEVTVKSNTGGDITVTDASAFAIGTEFTLGRFVRGVSRVFPKD